MPNRPSYFNIAFVGALTVSFVAAAVIALDFPWLARIYPLVIGSLGALLCGVELVRVLIARRKPYHQVEASGPTENEVNDVRVERVKFVIWLGGYLASIWALGFLPASWIFITLFLIFEGQVAPIRSVFAASAGLAVLLVLFHFMPIRTPTGVLSPEIHTLCRMVTQELSPYVC